MSDAYFLVRGLWAGFVEGEWGWVAVGVDAAALALPFVGVGIAKLPRILKRIDAMGDMLPTARHLEHARHLGLSNVGDLSSEARKFLKDAVRAPGFTIFKEGDDIVVFGTRMVRQDVYPLKGVYSLSESRVRSFRIAGDTIKEIDRGLRNRPWVALSADELVRYLL